MINGSKIKIINPNDFEKYCRRFENKEEHQ